MQELKDEPTGLIAQRTQTTKWGHRDATKQK
jgi:hypothetical protein